MYLKGIYKLEVLLDFKMLKFMFSFFFPTVTAWNFIVLLKVPLSKALAVLTLLSGNKKREGQDLATIPDFQ